MRTNIVLDDKLVKEGMRLTNIKTKKALVNTALTELVAKHQRRAILKLEGKVKWEGDLTQMRRDRT